MKDIFVGDTLLFEYMVITQGNSQQQFVDLKRSSRHKKKKTKNLLFGYNIPENKSTSKSRTAADVRSSGTSR